MLSDMFNVSSQFGNMIRRESYSTINSNHRDRFAQAFKRVVCSRWDPTGVWPGSKMKSVVPCWPGSSVQVLSSVETKGRTRYQSQWMSMDIKLGYFEWGCKMNHTSEELRKTSLKGLDIRVIVRYQYIRKSNHTMHHIAIWPYSMGQYSRI